MIEIQLTAGINGFAFDSLTSLPEENQINFNALKQT